MANQLIHKTDATDDELVREANAHFKGNRTKQVVAFILNVMREHQFHGMTHEDLHKEFPAAVRMEWLAKRPDRRQQIVTQLVGTRPNMARKRELAKQAQDIEDVLESKDITFKEFDDAYTSEDCGVNGDGEKIFHLFFEKFDWSDSKDREKQAVIASLIDEFLRKVEGTKPILTHLQVRRAISSVIWNKHLPAEMKARIDDARLEKEEKSSGKPFTAAEELSLVPPAEFVKHILLDDIVDVFRAANKAMGFRSLEEARALRDDVEQGKKSNDTPTFAPVARAEDGPKAPASKPAPELARIPPPLPAPPGKPLPPRPGKAATGGNGASEADSRDTDAVIEIKGDGDGPKG